MLDYIIQNRQVIKLSKKIHLAVCGYQVLWVFLLALTWVIFSDQRKEYTGRSLAIVLL